MFGKLRLRGVHAAGLVGTGLAAAAPSYAAEGIVLTTAAPDWGAIRYLQEQAKGGYRVKCANQVGIVIDFIPWPNFYERAAAAAVVLVVFLAVVLPALGSAFLYGIYLTG